MHRTTPTKMWPEGLHEVRPDRYVVVLNDRPSRGIDSAAVSLRRAKAMYTKARADAEHIRDVGGASDNLITLAVQWAVLRKAVSETSKVSLQTAAKTAINFKNKGVSVGDQIATATGLPELGRIVNAGHIDATTGELDKHSRTRQWIQTPPGLRTKLLNSVVGATAGKRSSAVIITGGAFWIKVSLLSQKCLVDWAVLRLQRLVRDITKTVDDWRTEKDVAKFLGHDVCDRAQEFDATTKAVWNVVAAARTKAVSAVLNLNLKGVNPVLPPCMRQLVDGTSPDAAEFVHTRRFHWLVLTANVAEKCGLGATKDVFPVNALGAITTLNSRERLRAIDQGYKSVRRAGPLAKCSVIAAKTLTNQEAIIKCPYAGKPGGCVTCHLKHKVPQELSTDAVTVGDVAAALLKQNVPSPCSKEGK